MLVRQSVNVSKMTGDDLASKMNSVLGAARWKVSSETKGSIVLDTALNIEYYDNHGEEVSYALPVKITFSRAKKDYSVTYFGRKLSADLERDTEEVIAHQINAAMKLPSRR